MEQFEGFPARMRFTPVPNLFFSSLLPQISDISELKVTLYIIHSVYAKKGYPRFTTYRELSGATSLMSSLRGSGTAADDSLRNALEMALKRGTILHLVLDQQGTPEDAYFLNTESDRRVVARIQSGELVISGLKAVGQMPGVTAGQSPDIFTLYEENIGMLTPMIADELLAAEKIYPEAWIADAIKEAVHLGKRNWRYISRILENWLAEGKDSGAHKRDSQKTDPDKYIRGEYGHIVRR